MKSEYFIGIDIGTSSVKAAAFGKRGELIDKRVIPYPTLSPRPGYSEQDPDLVFTSTVEALKQLISRISGQLKAVGFSSAMHSLIALDIHGHSISNSIIWADNRSAALARELRGTAKGHRIYRRTGTPIHPMSPMLKIAWLRQNRPEVFNETYKFADIKSYILFRLTGQLITDYSLASSSGLMDLKTLQWHPEALDYAGISSDRLPELVPTDFLITGRAEGFPGRLVIDPAIPFVAGASDGCLANLGAMALEKGNVVITVGTSGAVRATLPHPLEDARERIFNYWLHDGLYVCGGATNNGGVILDWFRKQFCPQMELPALMEEISSVPAGSHGLLFLPYLLGERAPVWDAEARGVFAGIQHLHQRADFARAVVEGIALNLFQIASAFHDLGVPAQAVYANGGFTQSDIWVQILADVFGLPTHIRGHEEGSAFGAALLAMKAIGVIDNFREMETATPIIRTFSPSEENHHIYMNAYTDFSKLYKSFNHNT
jgi:gluconokinase